MCAVIQQHCSESYLRGCAVLVYVRAAIQLYDGFGRSSEPRHTKKKGGGVSNFMPNALITMWVAL